MSTGFNVGQITPDSPFGKAITAMARDSKTVVEIGTWNGLGSTACILPGFTSPDQRLISIEGRHDFYLEALLNVTDPRSDLLYGTIVRPSDLPIYDDLPLPFPREFYDGEVGVAAFAPLVIDLLPIRFDLLVLDGGEISGTAEFKRLWGRFDRVALDDIHPPAFKNTANAAFLKQQGWNILEGGDRHGWLVATQFKTPEVKHEPITARRGCSHDELGGEFGITPP